MITRERRAREAAERQLAEVLEKAAEERVQAAEERRRLLALIEQLTERLAGNGRASTQSDNPNRL